DRLAAFLAEYLNRTGSIILILTLLFAAIILSTQFSFGRLFSALSQVGQERWAAMRAALEQRRDEKQREKQRQEVLKKHLGKESKERPKDVLPAVVAKAAPTPEAAPRPSKPAAMASAAAAALRAASSKATPPPIKRPAAGLPAVALAKAGPKEP